MCKNIFNGDIAYYIGGYGKVQHGYVGSSIYDKNNAANRRQLERLLALNQLLNIAEYYNRLHIMIDKQYVILYDKRTRNYTINSVSPCYKSSVEAAFNRAEDAQAVIDNPNFREILDIIYKD